MSGGASAELGYGWLLMVLAAALVWYGLRLHHRRAMARLEMRELELEGWIPLKLATLPTLWECPRCGLPAATAEGIQTHLSESSACAWLAAREEAAARAGEDAHPPEFRADVWPGLGDEEATEVSASERAELEGG